LGTGIPEAKRLRLIGWLRKNNVQLYTKVKIEAVSQQGVTFATEDTQDITLATDQVIILGDAQADKSLAKASSGHVPEIYVVGDAENSGLIIDAIADGFRVGCKI